MEWVPTFLIVGTNIPVNLNDDFLVRYINMISGSIILVDGWMEREMVKVFLILIMEINMTVCS